MYTPLAAVKQLLSITKEYPSTVNARSLLRIQYYTLISIRINKVQNLVLVEVKVQ